MKYARIASEHAGGQVALAAAIGVTVQAVNQWVTSNRVPGNRCIAVEEACGGVVTRYDLRPDIFGKSPATDKAAA